MPSKSKKQHDLMLAVAHNPAFAKKVGIAQSVGRDFAAADAASGKFSKGKPMAKHEMGSESGMSPRKTMASGGGGSFGVEPYAQAHPSTGVHPDHASHLGMAGAMEDHERGAPPAHHHTKGHMPAQAAPDHGPHGHHHQHGGHDHHNRGGKA